LWPENQRGIDNALPMFATRFLIGVVLVLGGLAADGACAESKGHQAYGAMRFGMTDREWDPLLTKALASKSKRENSPHGFTAEDLHRNFVTTGPMTTFKIRPSDGTLNLSISVSGSPLTEVMFMTQATYATYDTELKEDWFLVKKVLEGKFGPSKNQGAFPSLEVSSQSDTFRITDVWEVEGVRIEFGIEADMRSKKPDSTCHVKLRATEIKQR
jgi:hypothetical protein